MNVSPLLGVRESASDALQYGQKRHGEHAPRSSTERHPAVVWNVTRACDLACRNRHANAKRTAAPDEPTADEAQTFLDDLATWTVPGVLISSAELATGDSWAAGPSCSPERAP